MPNAVSAGIKTIGYTKDGLVFIQFVSSYNGEPFETTMQFTVDAALSFCRCIVNAAGEARGAGEVTH